MVVQKISNHSSVMTTSSRFLATNKNQSHFVESTSPEDVMATFRPYPLSQIGGCCMHCIPLLPSITITHVGTFWAWLPCMRMFAYHLQIIMVATIILLPQWHLLDTPRGNMETMIPINIKEQLTRSTLYWNNGLKPKAPDDCARNAQFKMITVSDYQDGLIVKFQPLVKTAIPGSLLCVNCSPEHATPMFVLLPVSNSNICTKS